MYITRDKSEHIGLLNFLNDLQNQKNFKQDKIRNRKTTKRKNRKQENRKTATKKKKNKKGIPNFPNNIETKDPKVEFEEWKLKNPMLFDQQTGTLKYVPTFEEFLRYIMLKIPGANEDHYEANEDHHWISYT